MKRLVIRRSCVATTSALVLWLTGPGAVAQPCFGEELLASETGVRGLLIADLDSDGDPDVISFGVTPRWYESDGADPPAFVQRQFDPSNNAGINTDAGFVIDLDGDSDLDVVSVSRNQGVVSWFRSDGATPPVLVEQVIASGVAGPESVAAADLNQDGHVDVVAALTAGNQIRWYENNGSSTSFVERVVATSALEPTSVTVADVDSDGDIDVIATIEGEDSVVWYGNDGSDPPAFTAMSVGALTNARHLAVGDIDGDGDLDVAAVSSSPDRTVWFENDGMPVPVFSSRNVDTGQRDPAIVYLADIDSDLDVDLVTGGLGIFDEDEFLAVHTSDGATPPSFTTAFLPVDQQLAPAQFASSLAPPVDISNDGRVDLVTAREESIYLLQQGLVTNQQTSQQYSFMIDALLQAAPGQTLFSNAPPLEALCLDGLHLVTPVSIVANTGADVPIGAPIVVSTDSSVSVPGTDRLRVVGPIEIAPSTELVLSGGEVQIAGELRQSAGSKFTVHGDLTLRGEANFVDLEVPTSQSGTQSIAAGDYDGDGDVDLFTSRPGWLENTGGGIRRLSWLATSEAVSRARRKSPLLISMAMATWMGCTGTGTTLRGTRILAELLRHLWNVRSLRAPET